MKSCLSLPRVPLALRPGDARVLHVPRAQRCVQAGGQENSQAPCVRPTSGDEPGSCALHPPSTLLWPSWTTGADGITACDGSGAPASACLGVGSSSSAAGSTSPRPCGPRPLQGRFLRLWCPHRPPRGQRDMGTLEHPKGRPLSSWRGRVSPMPARRRRPGRWGARPARALTPCSPRCSGTRRRPHGRRGHCPNLDRGRWPYRRRGGTPAPRPRGYQRGGTALTRVYPRPPVGPCPVQRCLLCVSHRQCRPAGPRAGGLPPCGRPALGNRRSPFPPSSTSMSMAPPSLQSPSGSWSVLRPPSGSQSVRKHAKECAAIKEWEKGIVLPVEPSLGLD
jgi:hypothetical protein